MTHAELNEAIYEVITSKFKKDCPEAFKAVEAAGYRIYKSGGTFTIRNDKTTREVYLTFGSWSEVLHYGKYTFNTKRIKCNKDLKVFDFVTCLEKPINRDWVMVRYPEMSTLQKKKEKLEDARFHHRWAKRHLLETQAEIAKLQQKLIEYSQDVYRSSQELKACKRELGLIK